MYTKRIKLNLLFNISYLNSNFAQTLGYLNPALDNAALVLTFQWQAQLSQNSSFVVTYSFQLKLHIYIYKKGYFNKLQSKVSYVDRTRIKSLLRRLENIGVVTSSSNIHNFLVLIEVIRLTPHFKFLVSALQ